ncbi:MAG TPA: hypothetical protein VJ725_27655 [Thermoanaerobaculia bacterium]|nr:hypothetical protein [Thermoanaerobaculia bacterium]
MKTLFLTTLLLATPATAGPLPDIQSVTADFVQADWMTVWGAEWLLEDHQAAAIPVLLSLLDRDEVVKLENTIDLIYPGAETFYGHGYIVSYDLDYLPARAGWALEELTFESFGFEDPVVTHEQLRAPALEGKMDVPMEEISPQPDPASRKARFAAATGKAKAWWKARNGKWSRLAALRAALSSGDSWRQMKALVWLRSGTSRCDGLDLASFKTEIRPLAEKLAQSGNPSVAQQAGYLLREGDSWYWHKTDPSYRYGSEDGVFSGITPKRPPGM